MFYLISKFQELETLVFSDWKRGILKKFKTRQNAKKAEFRNRSNEFSQSTSQQPSTPGPQRVSSSRSFSTVGQSDSFKSDKNFKLPYLKESSSFDSSNDVGLLSPTDSEINSPLTKSYSKDK